VGLVVVGRVRRGLAGGAAGVVVAMGVVVVRGVACRVTS
jgi:hypothetical protein